MKFHPPSELCALPATELARRIRSREVSIAEVVCAFLDRIEALNPTYNAIVSLRPREDILEEARAKDAALGAGVEPRPLFGLPIAVKDLALTKGIRTTHGSPIFRDFIPVEDEFFVARMKRAGAIVIGKTNAPEFGFGSQTYNPVFGPTRNALDPSLTAGGSSGGAAVALGLNMLPLADGSDMCGSLRNPAAFNGIYGFRPSPGHVAAGPSTELFLSQMGVDGPMARNVRDLALLLDVQAGHDPRAPLSLGEREGFLAGLEAAAAPGRIAWLGDLGGHLAMEDGILPLCEAALARFGQTGWRAEPVLPDFDFEALWRAFVTLRHATSGAALKHHYDNPAERALLKPEAVWEIEGCLHLTAPEIHAASVVRSRWYSALLDLFERYDLLALPTAQVFPFPVEIHWPSEIAGRAMDSYHRWMEVTALATMAGCPAVSVPVGRDARGRAMGMQLIGPPRRDLAVLKAAAAFEAITG